MEECQVGESLQNASSEEFEDVFKAMQTDKYWINFFVRPCCPPPSAEQAKSYIDKRRHEVESNSAFTADQKSKLLEVIDSREKWYLSSPFCKG